MNTTTVCVAKSGDKSGKIVGASPLDNVLYYELNSKYTIKVKFFYFDGTPVTDINEAIRMARDAASNKEYTHTDHFFVVVEVYEKNGELAVRELYQTGEEKLVNRTIPEQLVAIFVLGSLDNSVRANTNGAKLSGRIDNLNESLKRIQDYYPEDVPMVMALSEAGRPSFDGFPDCRENESSWDSLVPRLIAGTSFEYILTHRNNTDSDMAFGLAIFTNSHARDVEIETHNLLPEDSFGNAAVLATLEGVSCLFTHFPVDFRNKGEENRSYTASQEAMKILNSRDDFIFAMGDMNLIEGPIRESVDLSIKHFNEANQTDFRLLLEGIPTFMGAYFDAFPTDNPEEYSDTALYGDEINQRISQYAEGIF